MKTYYKEDRKMERVQAKSGRWYYRQIKWKECIECGAKIDKVSTYCQTCYGATRQSKNMDRVLAGEEFDRTMSVL